MPSLPDFDATSRSAAQAVDDDSTLWAVELPVDFCSWRHGDEHFGCDIFCQGVLSDVLNPEFTLFHEDMRAATNYTIFGVEDYTNVFTLSCSVPDNLVQRLMVVNFKVCR